MNGAPPIAPPGLIAHRGYALRHPENTLESIQSALEVGARYVEFDVQTSADGVPVVLHDADLRRTAGVEGRVTQLPLDRLREIDVGERARFGAAFDGVRIPTLEETVDLLEGWPDAFAFVELKRESLVAFGAKTVLDRVLPALAPLGGRCAIISFETDPLRTVRARGGPAIGWVIDVWSLATRARADALAPEYLFADRHLLPPPPAALWEGPWRWAVYEVGDAGVAAELGRRGVPLVETMAIGELLCDPRLSRGA